MARISNATARKLGLAAKPKAKANVYPIVEMCKAMGLLVPESEHRFAPPRKWRFDFAWPELMLALEIEGGVWTMGRHTRGSGFEADCEKYAEASILGWSVLRVTPKMVKDGRVFNWIRRFIDGVGSQKKQMPNKSPQDVLLGAKQK